MPLNNRTAEIATVATKWRHDLHRIPELLFQETKSSAYIQARLAEIGVDSVHTGFAKTGVVAVIKNGNSDRSIALRADFDALPMDEESGVDYASEHEGAMHACGHDGHASILLGTAQYLAETRNFDGTVYLIFQPAEEGGGGANVMIQDGLFDRFPADEVYALHNWPSMPVGTYGVKSGAMMATPARFTLTITGKGGHAAQPHLCVDPIVVGANIVTAWQTLVSRYANPLDPLVISTTMFNAGTASNVIPETAELQGTVRTFDTALQHTMADKMNAMAQSIATAFGATVQLNYEHGYPPTINHDTQAGYARAVCETIAGADNVITPEPSMGAEDFSYMLEKVAGCYVLVGNGDSHGLHHPKYIFNDDAIAYGIDFFVKMAETRLPK